MSIQDCLSGQSPDILIYLFTYLNYDNLIQVRQLSRRLNQLINQRVPVSVYIKTLTDGLRMIILFKKVRLIAPYGHSLTVNDLRILGRHLTELNMLKSNEPEIPWKAIHPKTVLTFDRGVY